MGSNSILKFTILNKLGPRGSKNMFRKPPSQIALPDCYEVHKARKRSEFCHTTACSMPLKIHVYFAAH